MLVEIMLASFAVYCCLLAVVLRFFAFVGSCDKEMRIMVNSGNSRVTQPIKRSPATPRRERLLRLRPA